MTKESNTILCNCEEWCKFVNIITLYDMILIKLKELYGEKLQHHFIINFSEELELYMKEIINND